MPGVRARTDWKPTFTGKSTTKVIRCQIILYRKYSNDWPRNVIAMERVADGTAARVCAKAERRAFRGKALLIRLQLRHG